MLFLSSAELFFLQNFKFLKNSSSVKQFGSRSGAMEMLGLIWVQTVCKGYQKTTILNSKEIINSLIYALVIYDLTLKLSNNISKPAKPHGKTNSGM